MRLWSRLGFQSRVLLPIVVGLSLRGCSGKLVLSVLTNRRRVNKDRVPNPRASSLLVRFGGVELESGLRVAGRAVGDGCVDAPRRTSTLP